MSDKTQIITQPHVKRATVIFKEFLHDHVFEIPHEIGGGMERLHLTFTSGMTDEDLTYWLARSMVRARNGCSSFAVQGDDSIGVVMTEDGIRFLEIDYSHYDQSQREIQIDCESRVMEALGMPTQIVSYLAEMSSMPATFVRGRASGAIKVRYETQYRKRLTGSPQTSLANSINNMLAIMILAKYQWNEDEAWPKIGFKAKSQWHLHVDQATFLRGMFWPLTTPVWMNGYQITHRWGWMPSAVCKMGKIQRTLRKGETVEQMAYGMAKNISVGACDIPILGAFREALLRASGVKTDLEVDSEAFRPTMQCRFPIDRAKALAIIFDRYQVTTAQVEELERLYSRVQRLPAFVQTEASRVIVERDYS
jgi:hypothetical protein